MLITFTPVKQFKAKQANYMDDSKQMYSNPNELWKNCLKEKSALCENVVMSCQSSLNTDPIRLTGLQQLLITVGNPNPLDPNLTNPIKLNNNTADKGSIGSSCHPLGQVGL